MHSYEDHGLFGPTQMFVIIIIDRIPDDALSNALIDDFMLLELIVSTVGGMVPFTETVPDITFI